MEHFNQQSQSRQMRHYKEMKAWTHEDTKLSENIIKDLPPKWLYKLSQVSDECRIYDQ